MKWLWIGAGVAGGYLLGNREGRERVAGWTKRAAEGTGIKSATGQVIDSAMSMGSEVRAAASNKSTGVMNGAAESLTDRMDSMSETVRESS